MLNDIAAVAVPLPLRRSFDFIVPDNLAPVLVGVRVLVPFGNRKLVGIVVQLKSHSELPKEKLKELLELIDSEPLFEPPLWSMLKWLTQYYLAPIGEVFSAALPVNLRQGKPIQPKAQQVWRWSEYAHSADIDELSRAPLQQAIVKRFINESSLSATDFRQHSSGWRAAIDALQKKGWLQSFVVEPMLGQAKIDKSKVRLNAAQRIQLNQQQQEAIVSLSRAIERDQFSCTLLHGVTGSGKTEVYFELIQKVVNAGRQVLIMVPEIGLTPQLIARINEYFNVPITVLHSGLNKTERHLAWWHARQGNAKIILGTRSAVFTSCKDLALIVVDEEHDASFKQQDGIRYQARDVAIYRAKLHDIPIVLGSATPSLETYANAELGRYQLLRLTERATQVALPQIGLLDLNVLPTQDGLSASMLEAIQQTLDVGKQVIIFLNRRGYAPVLYCSDCRETVSCHRCDANLTVHRKANRVRCHHCGYDGVVPDQCRHCQNQTLLEVGEGTQRVEETLKAQFSAAKILRIDRDSSSRKGELDQLLDAARDGDADILLGTQLLTKGHDFPNVALVGVLNADQGLYSTDFRASEILFQQILQVAGRAGRREQVGRVLIQTTFPDHPFFERIQRHDFDGFAQQLLTLRQQANFPPFGFFALLQAESIYKAKAMQFLRRVKQDIRPSEGVRIMDVIPSPMERRAGKFRAQLLICAEQRSALNASLSQWLQFLENNREASKLSSSVRWHLDIDPLNLY